MKTTILFICCLAVAGYSGAQEFNQSMAGVLKNMKAYTIEMIDRMPESDFDYRPVDSVRTFREQVQHIISVNYFLFNYYLIQEERTASEIIGQEAANFARHTGKAELLNALEQQLDGVIRYYEQAPASVYKKTYTFGTPEEPLIKDHYTISMLLRDHLTHHRAQLALYLRLRDIEPALYRGF